MPGTDSKAKGRGVVDKAKAAREKAKEASGAKRPEAAPETGDDRSKAKADALDKR